MEASGDSLELKSSQSSWYITIVVDGAFKNDQVHGNSRCGEAGIFVKMCRSILCDLWRTIVHLAASLLSAQSSSLSCQTELTLHTPCYPMLSLSYRMAPLTPLGCLSCPRSAASRGWCVASTTSIAFWWAKLITRPIDIPSLAMSGGWIV